MPRRQGASGRVPAHQNTHKFHHNANSKYTKTVLAISNTGVCRRCYEQIEWRKRYRKYKPLKTPGKCTKCSERTVLRAYHTLCAACGERKGFCCKCQGPIDAELTPKDGGAARAAGEEEGGDDVKGDAAAHDLEAETAPESGAGAAAAAAASSGASEAMLPTGGYATKPQAIQDAEAELEDLYASSCGLRERKRRSRIRVLERQLGQREEAASYAADAIAEEDAATVDEADGGPDGDAEEGDAEEEEGEGEEAAGAEADEADEGEASAAGGAE
ncbi:hypothetical protein FNF28_00170 [Cafeteria roenbergensis]|uniref:Uncharacterized protein n=1 Tax=Cafeteria roenbergensis TaxID=33653 RepID=A0A5A8E5P9_CAFRO|nr:hypothetical protein FNF28_00170 [Cafeteria roenbergensis]